MDMNHSFVMGIEHSISVMTPGLAGGNAAYLVTVKYRGRWGGEVTNRRLATTLSEAETLLEGMLEKAVLATAPVIRAEHGPGQFQCELGLAGTIADRVRQILASEQAPVMA